MHTEFNLLPTGERGYVRLHEFIPKYSLTSLLMSASASSNSMNDIVDNAKTLMASAQDKVRESFQFVRATESADGTALRSSLATAREGVSERIADAEVSTALVDDA